MIVDTLDQAARYAGIHPRFQAAFEFLRTTNWASVADGRIDIQGKELFALIQSYETKPLCEAKLEAHRAYIDIQFIISGEEAIGYAPLADQKEMDPFNREKDIGFYVGGATFTRLEKGMFAIYFPNDAHAPGRFLEKPCAVRKAVLKIAVAS